MYIIKNNNKKGEVKIKKTYQNIIFLYFILIISQNITARCCNPKIKLSNHSNIEIHYKIFRDNNKFDIFPKKQGVLHSKQYIHFPTEENHTYQVIFYDPHNFIHNHIVRVKPNQKDIVYKQHVPKPCVDNC